jgi:hypothetical protein
MTQDCRYLPLSCGHLAALQVKGDHGHVGRAQGEWRWDAPPLDARGGPLTRISEGAYGDGLTGLVWVGPLGAAPGVSQLVEVHFRDVATRGEPPVLALRWEATGPDGRLFPALDADISLTPAGEHATRLSLAGVYRPPLAALGAGLDRAVFHKVADATVRSLLARVADVLARPRSRPTLCREPAGPGGAGRRAVVELP